MSLDWGEYSHRRNWGPLLQRGEFSKLCIMTAETSQINFCPSSQDYGGPVLTLQARGCMNLLWEISLVQKEISKDTNIHIWHFLDSCCSVAHSCPILCDPVDRSPPGSSIYGISQARILEWVAIPFSSTAAAKTLQSYLCYPIDGSPPGSPVPGDPKAKDIKENSAQCAKLSVIFRGPTLTWRQQEMARDLGKFSR